MALTQTRRRRQSGQYADAHCQEAEVAFDAVQSVTLLKPRLPLVRTLISCLGLALLSGCSVHPVTGREQMLALSAVHTVHADLGFALTAGAQRAAAASACEPNCDTADDLQKLISRLEPIGAQLTIAARSLSPDLFERIDKFEIEVDPGAGIYTGSSARGRIVLGAGLAKLAPDEPASDGHVMPGSQLGGLQPARILLAFLIAREMAHVIARHAEENSGASIAISALGMLLPGINLVARFVATTVSAGALKNSWAPQQQREANDIAVALLERCGVSAIQIALALESGVNGARIPAGEWGTRYLESMQRVAEIAASPLRYSGIEG